MGALRSGQAGRPIELRRALALAERGLDARGEDGHARGGRVPAAKHEEHRGRGAARVIGREQQGAQGVEHAQREGRVRTA